MEEIRKYFIAVAIMPYVYRRCHCRCSDDSCLQKTIIDLVILIDDGHPVSDLVEAMKDIVLAMCREYISEITNDDCSFQYGLDKCATVLEKLATPSASSSRGKLSISLGNKAAGDLAVLLKPFLKYSDDLDLVYQSTQLFIHRQLENDPSTEENMIDKYVKMMGR